MAMAPPPAKEEYVNLFAKAAHFQNQNRVSSSPAAATALVSTGLRLAFNEQQQQQSKQMSNALRYSSSSPSLFASVSDELAAQVKQNEVEIDRFIREQVILARPIRWFWFSCSHQSIKFVSGLSA
jgi:E3 ubiquitin-protein ligase BOI and related proteins